MIIHSVMGERLGPTHYRLRVKYTTPDEVKHAATLSYYERDEIAATVLNDFAHALLTLTAFVLGQLEPQDAAEIDHRIL